MNGSESCHQGLHGEGKTVDDGADDKACEGEGEWMAEEGGDAPADCGARAEENEEEEAEYGGWEHEREGSKGLKNGEPAAAAKDQKRRERDGDGQQNRRVVTVANLRVRASACQSIVS